MYDNNGNLIRDDNKGITNIIYNHLNLPETIIFTNGTITFLYDANGNKLRKTVSTGIQQDYLGGIEYNNGTIEAVYHEEGRATPSGSDWQYEYYLKDHLGNTRVIFADSNNDGTPEIIQEADYYPFGMRHQNATATNHYLYNGKELNTDLGLDWYDYGFRWYDAEIGRFPSVDPIIENFPDLTPYNYASNNPSTLIDLWGLQGFDPNLLNEVLTKYSSTFTKAQNRTMKIENYIDENTKENKSGYIEFGYAIFQHIETGELHISEIEKGYPTYVIPIYAIDRFKVASPELFSQVRLIGIYHTHPANRNDFTDEILIDSAPISPQDFKGILGTAETYKRGGYDISEGFFLIADDVSGGRYAFVIENLELANQKAPLFKPDFSETKESMKKIILDIRKSADIRSSGGEKARQYYNKRLEGTGISLYYHSNRNSVNLMRIPRKQYFTGRLPTIH